MLGQSEELCPCLSCDDCTRNVGFDFIDRLCVRRAILSNSPKPLSLMTQCRRGGAA